MNLYLIWYIVYLSTSWNTGKSHVKKKTIDTNYYLTYYSSLSKFWKQFQDDLQDFIDKNNTIISNLIFSWKVTQYSGVEGLKLVHIIMHAITKNNEWMTVYPYSHNYVSGPGSIMLITRFIRVTPWMYTYV